MGRGSAAFRPQLSGHREGGSAFETLAKSGDREGTQLVDENEELVTKTGDGGG